MKKQISKTAIGFLTLGLLAAGVTTAGIAYAADLSSGSAKASTDSDYTLEEMLVYAIEDEYLAQAEYDVIMEKYEVQKPFSNILRAEGKHISLLVPLFETYDVKVPEKNWENMVTVPSSLETAFEVAVTAEEKNIAMYENFLKEDLPDDVKNIFEKLMTASERHLSAFQRSRDESCTGEECTGENRTGESCTGEDCTGESCTGEGCTGEDCTGESCTGESCTGEGCTGENCTGGDSQYRMMNNSKRGGGRQNGESLHSNCFLQ